MKETLNSKKGLLVWGGLLGAVIGAGSAYIFTRPFAKKHNLSISPVAGDGHYGVYASMTF